MLAKAPRRRFLTAAAWVGIAVVSRIGVAQTKQRVHRVGLLVLGPTTSPSWEELVTELSRLGYSDGINVAFDRRMSRDAGLELDRVAVELARANVDLILTPGGLTALAAKRATSTIPIVFFASPDPIGLGLVSSLRRPGANLTGSSIQAWETNAREIQLLAQASGRLTRLACLVPGPVSDMSPQVVARLTSTANALGIRIQFLGYESVRGLEAMVERLAREGVDGVALVDAPPSDAYRKVAAKLIELRLPSIGNPSEGYLLSYRYSPVEAARIAARQVDQVLRGADPGSIPIEQLSTFELEINMRTAKAMGLSIPSSVLLQATHLRQ